VLISEADNLCVGSGDATQSPGKLKGTIPGFTFYSGKSSFNNDISVENFFTARNYRKSSGMQKFKNSGSTARSRDTVLKYDKDSGFREESPIRSYFDEFNRKVLKGTQPNTSGGEFGSKRELKGTAKIPYLNKMKN
jgi:hypothetical protein